MSAVEEIRKEDLDTAFLAFEKTAVELKAAFEELSERARNLDLELHEANRRLETVLEALPEGVVASDRDGTISTMNNSASRILGIDRKDAEGRLKVTHIKDREGKPLLVPCREVEERKAGDGKVVRIRHVRLPGKGSLWILEDRSELEALESRVAHLDKLASLGRMALSIAHEIRNPLNGVAGFAGLLEKRLKHGKEGRYARLIIEGVKRIDAIINNLLCFARPSDLNLKKLDLKEVVRNGLDDWKEIDLEFRDPGCKAFVMCDPVALKQVLDNLLRNSLEAGGEGTRVLVSIEDRSGSWVLWVEDDGPGIPVEKRESVFEPFNSGKRNGTGLGLSIVRRIAELHRGKAVAADPEVLGGARVELIFPREEA